MRTILIIRNSHLQDAKSLRLMLDIDTQYVGYRYPTRCVYIPNTSRIYIQRVRNRDLSCGFCINSVYYAEEPYTYSVFYAKEVLIGSFCRMPVSGNPAFWFLFARFVYFSSNVLKECAASSTFKYRLPSFTLTALASSLKFPAITTYFFCGVCTTITGVFSSPEAL